jgi:hypothetical protein
MFLGGCKLSPATQATQIALAVTETPVVWTKEAPAETSPATTSPTTTVTHIPSPTMTATPEPTDTPKPTNTPKPTSIPKPTNTPAKSAWDRYLPRTMTEIIVIINPEGELDTLAENELYVEMGLDYQCPSSVQMIYSGEFREVIDPRYAVIVIWLDTFAPQLTTSEREELFETEALFTENGKEYWLPVQKPLIKIMKEELEPGDEVTLFLLWVGATKVEDETDYAFLVNAFK